jgi:hypothetical protein
VKQIFLWRRWEKGNRHGDRLPLDRNDVGWLNTVKQEVCAATEAPHLRFRRLGMSLLLIGGRAGKRIILSAAGGRDRRAGVRRAIQLIAADLRERQIGKDQEKKKENYPAMQVFLSC